MSNPLLKNSVFQTPVRNAEVMTISGTINKSIILWVLLAVGAFYSWTHPSLIMPLMLPILLGGFALAVILSFKMKLSPFLSPIYAVCEGLILGIISVYFEKLYPGIVVNAVLLTMCVLFCMLAAYKTNMLRATPMFKKIVILSTFAIAFAYLIDLLIGAFGARSFNFLSDSFSLGSSGGIIISLIIVVIASLNLIIDFDLIERGAQYGVPKYMEWYSSFALMVTLVWLYLETLRFLSKTKN
ncbi:MAG: Bax inhibitor-1/YccA family protein [Endomicrobium sp.]|nr:Bax inhibitor-1/YccA family protein [Endomicrobium sp.]